MDDHREYLLNKISHTQKDEYYMDSFMWNVVTKACSDWKRSCRYVGQRIQNFTSKMRVINLAALLYNKGHYSYKHIVCMKMLMCQVLTTKIITMR